MAKAFLICGRLCCGKTTYAHKLRMETRAALLSLDELMLSMFDEYLGEQHEACAAKCRQYLLAKSLELLETGIDVILDWGFWTVEGRKEIRAFYEQRGYEVSFHYLSIAGEEWLRRCRLRNAQVDRGETVAYHVDEGLAAKASQLFEAPEKSEMDLWLET